MLERATVAVSLRSAWRHEARLNADVAVAHVALDLRLRNERGDRVDDDEVDRARADEHVGDLERLLAVVRLRDEELVGLHAELARVGRDRARAPRR